MSRISKDEYYLQIAREVSKRSTCMRRRYGAIIVKLDQVISTGYCGAPRDTANCVDVGLCLRKELKVKRGEHYEWCRSVHAEMNAIIHTRRLDMIDSYLYLVGIDAIKNKLLLDAEPCKICKRIIINSGISKVIAYSNGGKIHVIDVRKEWTKRNIGEVMKKKEGWIITFKDNMVQ